MELRSRKMASKSEMDGPVDKNDDDVPLSTPSKKKKEDNIKVAASSSSFSASSIHSLSMGIPPWTSMSFACGGWLQFYMYGVARALQASGYDSPSTVTYCGCSAGALTAVGLATEGDFDGAVNFCKETCVPQAWGHVKGLFKLGEYVSQCIDLLVIPNYKPIKPGKLQLAVTKLPFFTAERVKEFSSKEDLKDALMASVAAYPAAPLVFRCGRYYMDGGITDFQPIVDADTITVSPFYFSDCDIRPSRYVPLWWAFLPPKNTDTVDWLYALGFEDGMNYLEKRGLNGHSTKSKSHLREIDRSSHPYDTPRRVSVHRVLGYDLGNMTCEYGAFVLDFTLLLAFILLWKPFALFLIYIELLIHVLLYLAKSFLNVLLLKLDTDSMDKAWDCFFCIFSLSLALRFFTGRPSSVELRKHDRLQKRSLLYRVFRHII